MQRRLLSGQRGSNVKGRSTQTPFRWNLSWLRDVCVHMEGSWGTPNTDCEPGKSNRLTKGSLEEIPHKSNSNCQKEVTRDSSSESPGVPTHTYCTLFLLINTLLASLLFVFVEILFHKAEGPGPLSLTPVQWLEPGAIIAVTQPNLWLGTQTPLQAVAVWGHLRSTSVFMLSQVSQSVSAPQYWSGLIQDELTFIKMTLNAYQATIISPK